MGIDRLNTALIFARYALAAAFISAVIDRFGVWGNIGTLGVSWGSMAGFDKHVAALNPWLPDAFIPSLSWFVTILEAILGILLIIGYQLRLTALISGVLLLIFAVAMSVFQTIKLPLNFSVFTASACAFIVYLHASSGSCAK